MSFDWNEYLTLARNLAQGSTTPVSEETKKRAAISRAYYAAFCQARDFAKARLGARLTGHGPDHGIVFRSFKRYRYKNQTMQETYRRIGLTLPRLYDNRNKADYDPAVSRLDALTDTSLDQAEAIITDLGSLP
ncbi:MAG: hypothetical protein A2Z21_07340 [Candidatus Fraserbacteria bacterium RBG_16_55_9]|uniref:HEPN domain-containing protein n=1 Tax=Fraserbacteria sp. (strain RBG_16_55_9) TaxID=1817864 RepID=A0A1F5V0Q5_FRAXR|nr:MAG: hypothetical protein A2Z21_07340 [Candidatus Fraserbacteria bacterium RBG_16_55_9]